MKKAIVIKLIVFLTVLSAITYAQEENRYKSMTREEILQLSSEELLAIPFEDLLYLANKLGISIDDLLKMNTSVASKTVSNPRETAGIISIITEEEIKKSGARDLIDVLQLVPGFEFGYDGYGVFGLGMRGNWVHEGKLLLMIDNQEMNELFYYNNAFGNHFSVQQIKRIEIIRGPGSAIYGGNAELGVIHIITKSGEDLKGGEAVVSYGQLSEIKGRNNYNFSVGNKFGDWDISLKGFLGRANRSEESDITFSLDTLDFSDEGAKINTESLNFGLKNNNLSLRLIYDSYVTEYTFNYWHAMNTFKTIAGELSYQYKINEKLSLIPLISYKNSVPYYEEGWYRNVREIRYKANISAVYRPSSNLNFLTGLEYYRDHCWMFEDSVGAYFYYDTTKNSVTFNNYSLFAQGTYKWEKINFIAGVRAEHHDYYGNAFAPRAGITGIFGDFHMKLLFSRAFRAPGIGNIDVGNNLSTEYTNVAELELGYKLNANSIITANLYDITIFNPIIYFEIGDGEIAITEWGFSNFDKSGSRGFELEYRMMYNKGSLTANYSHYSTESKEIPELYSVPGYDGKVLAFAPHKFGLSGTLNITGDFSVSATANYIGERFAYASEEGYPDSIIIKKFDPFVLLSLNLSYQNFLIKGLDFSLGCFDILNQKPPVLQPYNGWKSPYPGRSREIVGTLTYRFRMK